MSAKQTVTHLPVEALVAHPGNIRDDLGDLTELAASIREHGILQPLTVTEHPASGFLLIAGHRRLSAAVMAGVQRVPVIIRHGVDDTGDQLVLMLVENCHRRDLNPMERADAYDALRNRGLTPRDIAQRTGSPTSTVTYFLRLLDLPQEDQDEIRAGNLAVSRALAAAAAERQEERLRAEGRPVGRPKGRKTTPHFSAKHPLSDTARRLCSHRGRPKVGEVACGPCWEAVIRADATGGVAVADQDPDTEQSVERPPMDEIAIERAMLGEPVKLSNRERAEAVRRLAERGLSDAQIGDLLGIATRSVFRVRDQHGFESRWSA